MAKSFKLPKRINGIKLPRRARRQANRVIGKLQGEELEALIGVVLSAVVTHVIDRSGSTRLSRRLRDAVGGHLAH